MTGEALIDLGELPPGGGRQVRPEPVRGTVRPYRPALLVLALALVALLGGAGLPRLPPSPRIIPARLGDATFTSGNLLFVVGSGPDQSRNGVQIKIISTYALPGGALLSMTTVAVTGAIFDVTEVGSTVLVSYQVDESGGESTVALTADTDRAIWRRPARMIGASARAGLVMLRENNPVAGPLHWYGIDLATGTPRWTLTQPERGFLTQSPDDGDFPDHLISVDLDGTLLVRDPVTAAITARTTITPPADWPRRGIALWPDRDLLLLGDHSGATAYAMSDLALRWHTGVDLYSSFVGTGCGPAVCLFSPRGGGGVTVLDRSTGRLLWASTRWLYGNRAGPYLLAVRAEDNAEQHLDVVDLATGKPIGTLGLWQTAGAPLTDGTVVGLRQDLVTDVVWYARLDPATRDIRVLGVARAVSGDCDVAAAALVCRRTDASVGVWPLTTAR